MDLIGAWSWHLFKIYLRAIFFVGCGLLAYTIITGTPIIITGAPIQ